VIGHVIAKPQLIRDSDAVGIAETAHSVKASVLRHRT
jgi:hypothetical protein